MRVCLIFPQSTFLEDPMVFPPLGLWWLWSVLEQSGHDVSFIDMSEHNFKPQDIPHGFDVYMVSGTSPQGREIRKLGREFQWRGVPAVLGGPHATAGNIILWWSGAKASRRFSRRFRIFKPVGLWSAFPTKRLPTQPMGMGLHCENISGVLSKIPSSTTWD